MSKRPSARDVIRTTYLEKYSWCPICERSFFRFPSNPAREVVEPVIDHCHSTGKFRALLCGDCNKGLGFFKDDIHRLENAITYLNNWSGGYGEIPET